jgi:hypothetical protein
MAAIYKRKIAMAAVQVHVISFSWKEHCNMRESEFESNVKTDNV